MFYQVNHIKSFSFSFLYCLNLASINALSILHVKHPSKHNNQQCNIQAIMEKIIPIHVSIVVFEQLNSCWDSYEI